MRRTAAVLLTAVLASSGLAFADHDGEYVPDFVRQDAFFRASTTPLGNADAAVLGEYVTWNEDVPTSPVSAVYAMNNLSGVSPTTDDHRPEDFFTAAGTFTGDLDELAFDLYAYNYAQSADLCDLSLSFELVVDGVTLLSQDATGSQGIRTERIDDTTVVAKFTLTNIFATMEEAEHYSDIEAHAGPEATREVTVNIQNFYICNELAVAYDGVDHPSTIRANFDDYFHADIDVQSPPPPLAE